MCGILAISESNLDIKNYKIDAMLNAIKHRGPDGNGQMMLKNCFLGHQRLSIIDIENGVQPMQSNDHIITFNGEIYNYKELKSILVAEGFTFKTNSDTEVILKSYEKWGEGCVEKFDGMFAFAIWDIKKNQLFIARDRFGKKPVFYSLDDGAILLSSEIKSILASERVVPEVDYSAIDNYLRLMYIPPWKSVYKNIHQIPPAHYAVFNDGKITIKRYWKLTSKPITVSYQEAKKEVHRLLVNAVSKRLLSSDVEVGSFLSGGVDSSLITLIASKITGNPLKVFSVSYKEHDELPFASEVSDKINSNLFKVDVDYLNIPVLENVVKYFDEPHANTSNFPQHLVSRLASKKVKVVLSGDGADELFLGYKWHTKKDGLDLFERRMNIICAFDYESRRDLWKSDKYINDDILAPEAYLGLVNDLKKVEIFDITSHLPGQILTKVDRASMMHSLEVRMPFLDTELVEYVFNLPHEYKIDKDGQKSILRDILSEYMPKKFAYRKKQGFGSPIWLWLKEKETKKYIYSKLGHGAVIRKFLNGKQVDKYIFDLYKEDNTHERAGQRVWVLLCLELWAEQNRQYL
jgi:asparagine synthase (glutamine-hydrolysing)